METFEVLKFNEIVLYIYLSYNVALVENYLYYEEKLYVIHLKMIVK